MLYSHTKFITQSYAVHLEKVFLCVSVYSLSPHGKQSQTIRDSNRNPDCQKIELVPS